MGKRMVLWLATTFIGAAPVLADDTPWHVEPFVAVYKAKVGIAKGETRLQLQRVDDQFVLESWTELKGLVSLFKRGEIYELCRFDFVDGEVLPSVFERVDTISGEDRNVRVDYDWTRNVARVTYQDKTRDIDIEPGVTNTLLMQVALMQSITSGDRRERFDAVGHKGRMRFDVRYEGEGEAPALTGTTNALRYSHSREDSGIRTTFWAIPEFAHLPARADIDKAGELKGRLRLADYSLHDAALAAVSD